MGAAGFGAAGAGAVAGGLEGEEFGPAVGAVAGFAPPSAAGGVAPSLAGETGGAGACASAEGLGIVPFPCNGSWSGAAVGVGGCAAVDGAAAEPRCPNQYPAPKHSPHKSNSPKTIPSCPAVVSVSSVSCPRSGPSSWGSSPSGSSSKYPRIDRPLTSNSQSCATRFFPRPSNSPVNELIANG